MNYKYLKVKAQLAEYIRTVLVFDSFSGTNSSTLPLFTKGQPVLLCNIVNNRHYITLFGQSVPDEKWTDENTGTIIAFFFKPFAMGPIFKLSAQEMKGKPVEFNRWNTQKAMAINMQLFHSKSTEETINILSHFIFTQIQSNKRKCEIIRYATDKLMQDSNSDVFSQLLQELNLTERTFQRIFKKYVGVTASEYRRICQFYFAFSQLKGGHFDKMTDVAFANGYFDQSHYIRSFKAFTNTTPNEYLQSGLNKKVE